MNERMDEFLDMEEFLQILLCIKQTRGLSVFQNPSDLKQSIVKQNPLAWTQADVLGELSRNKLLPETSDAKMGERQRASDKARRWLQQKLGMTDAKASEYVSILETVFYGSLLERRYAEKKRETSLRTLQESAAANSRLIVCGTKSAALLYGVNADKALIISGDGKCSVAFVTVQPITITFCSENSRF